MKYKDFDGFCCGNGNKNARMVLVCSECECGVDQCDKFCRNCGRKLSRIKEYIPMKEILGLINGSLGRFSVDG